MHVWWAVSFVYLTLEYDYNDTELLDICKPKNIQDKTDTAKEKYKL